MCWTPKRTLCFTYMTVILPKHLFTKILSPSAHAMVLYLAHKSDLQKWLAGQLAL